MKPFQAIVPLFLILTAPAHAEVTAFSVSSADRGKSISISVETSPDFSGCDLRLYGSARRKALSGADISREPFYSESQPSASRRFSVSSLARPSKKRGRRTAVHFRAEQECPAATFRSRIERVGVRVKQRRRAPRLKGWIAAIGEKLDLQAVSIVEAFPALDPFNTPTDLRHPGDGSNRLFVVQQTGEIYVFQNSPGTSSSSLFLDLTGKTERFGERGLLGLAFDPSFSENGYLYVYYTDSDDGDSILERYTVSDENDDLADPDSVLQILRIPQPIPNHNGGGIQFGPDGYLYLALGDGGGAGDPEENGQDPTTLLGSILRIDVSSSSESEPYVVPSDNPFVESSSGTRAEIYAYGLRNPWRISFDPATETLWAGDVGQSRSEEINIVRSGDNLGWNTVEGRLCYPEGPCQKRGLRKPLHVYPRKVGSSVTGGYVYRGERLPPLYGKYLFADFAEGKVWALSKQGKRARVHLLEDTEAYISTFGIDQDGELYFFDYVSGKIYTFE